jgi:hypothetical protein
LRRLTATAIGWLAAVAPPLQVDAADAAACDSISVEVSDGRDQGFTLRFRHAD